MKKGYQQLVGCCKSSHGIAGPSWTNSNLCMCLEMFGTHKPQNDEIDSRLGGWLPLVTHRFAMVWPVWARAFCWVSHCWVWEHVFCCGILMLVNGSYQFAPPGMKSIYIQVWKLGVEFQVLTPLSIGFSGLNSEEVCHLYNHIFISPLSMCPRSVW